MAVGLKEIKRRIKSVKNTQAIAKAMEMVAAARLKRYQDKLIKLKDYVQVLEEGIKIVLPQVKTNVFFSATQKNKEATQKNKQDLIGVVLFIADRGLCGSYNSNLLRETEKFIKSSSKKNEVLLWTIGKKGYRYFSRRLKSENIINFELSTKPNFKELQTILNSILSYYTGGKVKEVIIIRTKFISTSKHQVILEKLLPFEIKKMPSPATVKEKKEIQTEYIFEPQPEEMVKSLVERYLFSSFYNMFLESQAAEHAARMLAMQGAGKNAKEMIDKLTLEYNKSRQAAITKELLEIVGGAEALK